MKKYLTARNLTTLTGYLCIGYTFQLEDISTRLGGPSSISQQKGHSGQNTSSFLMNPIPIRVSVKAFL